MVWNKENNIIGKVYGRLTIISEGDTIRRGNQWKRYVDAKCECGKQKKILLSHLKNGEISSCGCIRFKKGLPIIGKRYGRLVIREILNNPNTKNKKAIVDCDCGNRKEVILSLICSRNNPSCGCMIGKNQEKDGSGYHTIYLTIKKNAERRKIPFTLDEELFISMIKSNCFYCDSGPSNKNTRGKHRQIVTLYNGIDRVSSSEGYIEGNVVPCCKRCNYAKAEMSVDEFIKHINKIYQWIAKWDGKLPTQVLGGDMNMLMQMK